MLDRPFFHYLGTVAAWIDSDTADILLDLGFSTYQMQRFRLLAADGSGVDGAELNSRDVAERERARAGKARALELAPVGSLVAVKSIKGPRVDGFRRWLAPVFNADGISVGDALLAEGLAVPWVRS